VNTVQFVFVKLVIRTGRQLVDIVVLLHFLDKVKLIFEISIFLLPVILQHKQIINQTFLFLKFIFIKHTADYDIDYCYKISQETDLTNHQYDSDLTYYNDEYFDFFVKLFILQCLKIEHEIHRYLATYDNIHDLHFGNILFTNSFDLLLGFDHF